MTKASRRLELILALKTQGVEEAKEILDVMDRLDKGMGENRQTVADLDKGYAALALTAGITAERLFSLAQGAIATGAEFERLETALQTALGSNAAADAAFQRILQFATDTPFAVQEITESFIKLSNRGIIPTNEELRQLGDLAASQGKSLDQLTEAVLDALTGENERLKEFGIQAQKSGDQVTFAFKGINTTAENTPEAIKNALLAFGDLETVAGGLERQSQTLNGAISNLGDATDQASREFFEFSEGAIKPTVQALTALIQGFVDAPRFVKVIIFSLVTFTGVTTAAATAILATNAAMKSQIAQSALLAIKLELAKVKTIAFTVAQQALVLGAKGTLTVIGGQIAALGLLAAKLAVVAAAFVTVQGVVETFSSVTDPFAEINKSAIAFEQTLLRLEKAQGKQVSSLDTQALALKRIREEQGLFRRTIDDFNQAVGLTTSRQNELNAEIRANAEITGLADRALAKYQEALLQQGGIAALSADEQKELNELLEIASGAVDNFAVDAQQGGEDIQKFYVKALQNAKDATNGVDNASKEALEALKELTKEYERSGREISSATQDRINAVLQAQLDGVKSAESAAKEITAIEQAELVKQLANLKQNIDARKAELERVDPSQRKAELEKIAELEREAQTLQTDILRGGIEQREALEAEARERARQAFEDVADRASRAAQAVVAAQSQRNLELEQLYAADQITQEQFEDQKLAATQNRLNQEIEITKTQIAELQALPRPDNPEQVKENLDQIAALRQNLTEKTIELIQSERAAQEQLQQREIELLNQRAETRQQQLEADQRALDLQIQTLDRQSGLLQQQFDLQSALSQQRLQNLNQEINQIELASRIRAKLDGDAELSLKDQQTLRRQLNQLGLSGIKDEEDAQKRTAKVREQIFAEQQAALEAEQQAQTASLELEISKAQILAEQNILRAQSAELTATLALENARATDASAEQLQTLERLVTIAQQQVSAAERGLSLQSESAALARQTLAVQQQSARSALNNRQETERINAELNSITGNTRQATQEADKLGDSYGRAASNARAISDALTVQGRQLRDNNQLIDEQLNLQKQLADVQIDKLEREIEQKQSELETVSDERARNLLAGEIERLQKQLEIRQSEVFNLETQQLDRREQLLEQELDIAIARKEQNDALARLAAAQSQRTDRQRSRLGARDRTATQNLVAQQLASLGFAIGQLSSGQIQFNGGIPGFANGVSSFRGGLAMVGENGRELVTLPTGAGVTSNTGTEDFVKNTARLVNEVQGLRGELASIAATPRSVIYSATTPDPVRDVVNLRYQDTSNEVRRAGL